MKEACFDYRVADLLIRPKALVSDDTKVSSKGMTARIKGANGAIIAFQKVILTK